MNEQIYLPSEMNEWGLHRSVLRTDFSKVNLNFSPDNQNYAPAEVDFRILEDGDILEVRIVQYIPMDFLQETMIMSVIRSIPETEILTRIFP